MDSATVALLRMEAMGNRGAAANRGVFVREARERQQERAWPMANLANPGTIAGDANEFLQRDGPARTGPLVHATWTNLWKLRRVLVDPLNGGFLRAEFASFEPTY